MIDEKIKRLLRAFPHSYVMHIAEFPEFIASNKGNQYFCLDGVYSLNCLQQKVISNLSRGACKTIVSSRKKENEEFYKFMLNGINTFLETEFTHEDIERIYTHFGNGCNSHICFQFVNDNFDMDIIDELERRAND